MDTFARIGLVILAGVIGVLLYVGPAWAIGASRGRSGAGLALGIFLGWIGAIIAAFLPRSAEAEAEFQADVRRRQAQLRRQDHRRDQELRRADDRRRHEAAAFDRLMDDRWS
jgi:hypothetical protein